MEPVEDDMQFPSRNGTSTCEADELAKKLAEQLEKPFRDSSIANSIAPNASALGDIATSPSPNVQVAGGKGGKVEEGKDQRRASRECGGDDVFD
jgi:hypothetical protein